MRVLDFARASQYTEKGVFASADGRREPKKVEFLCSNMVKQLKRFDPFASNFTTVGPSKPKEDAVVFGKSDKSTSVILKTLRMTIVRTDTSCAYLKMRGGNSTCQHRRRELNSLQLTYGA